MLVLARKVHNLRYFCFGDLIGKNAAETDAAPVNMQHDTGRFFAILAKKLFKHVNDELHRGVIVVQHQDFIHGWFFGLDAGLGDHADTRTIIIVPVRVRHIPDCPSRLGQITETHLFNMDVFAAGSKPVLINIFAVN
jgi:hypothetical protein